MAEFGISATQLTEPQGSGARAVAPVETMNIGPNPMFKIAQNVTDIFAKGIQANRKQEAEALKSSVVKSYYEEVNKITSGVEQGSVKPAEASVRARNLLSRFLAQNPGLTTELREAANTLSTFSTLGSIEDQVKADRETRKRQLADAEKEGLVLSLDASPEEQDAVIKTYALTVRNENEFKRMAERKRFANQMSADERARMEYEDKENSFQMVREVAGQRLSTFNLYVDGLRRDVASGKKTVQDARIEITRQAVDIRAQLTTAARVNQQFAQAYTPLFEENLKIALQSVDPQVSADVYGNQLKALKNKAALMAAASDPETLAAFAIAEQLPNLPQIQVRLSAAAVKAFSKISTTPLDGYAPTVIGAGDAQLEKDVVGAFKESVKGAGETSEEKKAIIEIQSGNTANHLLIQSGEAASKGNLSGETLLTLTTGVADPGFYKLIKAGKVDVSATNAFAKPLQILFNQAERNLVERLNRPIMTEDLVPVFNRKDARGAKAPVAEGKEKTLMDVVDFVPGPGGVSIVLKDAGKTKWEQHYNTNLMNEVKQIERVLNTGIRAAAHISGTNDYKAYYENNKHDILKELFPKPKEASPKFSNESEMAAGIKPLMAIQIPKEEKNAIRKIYEETLKRTDLSSEARKEIEKELQRFK